MSQPCKIDALSPAAPRKKSKMAVVLTWEFDEAQLFHIVKSGMSGARRAVSE